MHKIIILVLLISFLPGNLVGETKDNIFLNRVLIDWVSHVFKKPEISQVNITQLTLGSLELDGKQERLKEDYCHPYNKSKKMCLSIEFNFDFEKNGGEVTMDIMSPDSTVYLIEYEKNEVYQLLACGSYGMIHGAFWLSNSVVIIYGIHEWKEGFINVYNLSDKTLTEYTIKDNQEILREKVFNYLIKIYSN